MTYSYSTNTKQDLHKKEVGVTKIEIDEKDIVVNFSDTLRELSYTLFERKILEICEGFKIVFLWRYGYDSVRIHLPKNALQDVLCVLKNFLKTFSFAHAV